MKRTSSTQQWAWRRSEALLRLFKMQAPGDFRAQVLGRIHERQHLSTASPPLQTCLPRGWRQLWARLRQMHPRKSRRTTFLLVIGRASVTALGAGLLWWGLEQYSERPGPLPGHESLAGVPSVAISRLAQDERVVDETIFQTLQFRAASLIVEGDVTQSDMPVQETAVNTAADSDILQEQSRRLPPASRPLSSVHDPPPVIKTEPQSLYATRAVRGK